MLAPYYSRRYRKAYKRLAASGRFDVRIVNEIINTLMKGKKLAEKHKDHSLTGDLREFRECHLKPNLLLIYRVVEGEILYLENMGSHSELFD